MQNIYEKNFNALKIKDPLLAISLANIKPNEKFDVFMDKDPANFNIIHKSSNTPLFIGKPLEETMQKVADFSAYVHYPYLYFYGLGNGIFYRLLLGNSQLKRIVVIEPEIEILFIVFNLVDFEQEILSDRVIFLYSKLCTYHLINSLFEMDKKSKIYSKVYDLHIFNPYYEVYQDEILKLNQFFIKAIEHGVISIGNDTRDAITGIKQHIQNLPDALSSPTLINLVGNLKNRDTAIIVSTGPSLSKQLETLKIIAPFVTIFCIDASFPILHKNGIKPDVVLSLERVEATARFYYDTPEEAQEGVVFAITSIVHKRLKESITKGIKQFSFRPFGYTNLFGFHEYGYLGIGMSAANMAYELVVHSRFKRCIIIGQDLAFGDDGSSHAQNALYGSDEIKPKPENEKLFTEKYGGGGEVETTQVWKLFLEFFEKDIAQTPYRLEIINATEGGARIHGTTEMSFQEAIKMVDTTSPKPSIKLTYPEQNVIEKNIQIAREKCEDIISYGSKQKNRVEKLFLKVAKYTEELEKLNEQNNLEKINFKKLSKLLDEIDEIKKLFDEKKFNDYFVDAIQSYIFHQELDIAKLLVKNVKDELQTQAKQIEWIYLHKYWLFSLAGGMDCVIEIVKEGMMDWKK
ncbi:motility associated factor glycosyltransferase family protein [Helicobacter cappadocius]|uniref:Motility associated factor glycosyltransferase family protein n=1 Tax=Helicobacter cappadocius TaxID=3063998 RepID=A0AA90PJY3_9HELI|nr:MULTISPECIES: motility associated factor glycosyltransferase family protein [unclassified Helicobacter]MDO7252832.1 motility associated factor glycosyltransferase family protein [Helicobacter sp. faydin-H75]MDP2538875.1 motility associated factor glycosyltransferase family protein [Helicobacter sp. faydin-H76]